MAWVITMPKFGLTMETGRVVAWLKHPGERVAKGEPLAEIETDKIATEFESPVAGHLLKIVVEEGSEAKVKEPICVIGEADETTDLKLPFAGSTAQAEMGVAVERPSPSEPLRGTEEQGGSFAMLGEGLASAAPVVAGVSSHEREGPAISPRARKLMEARGINISAFLSLNKQRITEADVQKYLSDNDSQAPLQGPEKVELTGTRKRIAERMVLSKSTIPHFYLRTTIDATAIVRMHRTLEFKPAYNDLIIKACTIALNRYTEVNVSLVENVIIQHLDCNIGFAVSVEKGLVVPVVHGAEAKSLKQICIETSGLVGRARTGTLTLEDVTGSTFTITNLGAHAIDEFSAIINPPESAILAVGRILLQPAVVNQQIIPRHSLKLTLSVDHRTIDGWLAAQFVSCVKELLEAGDCLLT